MQKFIFLSFLICLTQLVAQDLKVHGIFRSHMVIQRDKPIKIWGWAKKDSSVSVKFGDKTADTKAKGDKGLWEVTFEAQAANPKGQSIVVTSADQKVEMIDILIGDVWVMNGQSNMEFGLKAVYQNNFESAMAHVDFSQTDTSGSEIYKHSGIGFINEDGVIRYNQEGGTYQLPNLLYFTCPKSLSMPSTFR